MSKLNQRGLNVQTNIHAVAAKHNYDLGYSANGNLQFRIDPLNRLYDLTTLTLFGKDRFYHTSDQFVRDLRLMVKEVVQEGAYDFVANLAIHARTEMNIRTMPIVLVVEFAKALRDKGDTYVNMRSLTCDVIQRADQINDLYAYALEVFGDKKKVPMAIKRGVADAFNKFGEYHFAKYNRPAAVKFRDVLRIVHPEAKNAQQGVLFKKIMEDNLTIPKTWETEKSKNGQLSAGERRSEKEVWTDLVKTGSMGYQALLSNLRNIHAAGLDSAVLKQYVFDVISDPFRVSKSGQLPYKFVTAFDVVKSLDSRFATAVSKAVDASVKNLPSLGDRVVVIIDFSGSMGGDTGVPISTSTLLAASLLKANEYADKLAVILFGSEAKVVNNINTNDSVFGIQKELLTHRRGGIGGSTNFGAALDKVKTLGWEPDTVIVFTDREVNYFPYGHLKSAFKNKDVLKIVTNVEASGTTPFIKEDGWYTLSGWDSAMYRWIPSIKKKVTVVEKLSVPYYGLNRPSFDDEDEE